MERRSEGACRLIGGLLLGMVVCSCATSDTDRAAPPELAEQPFFHLMRFSHLGEVPLTVDQMISRAQVIVVGGLEGVENGRTIDFAQGAAHPLNTAVFRLRVDRTLKGPARPFAYIEHIRGGIPPQDYAEVLPRALSMIALLAVPDGWKTPVYKFEGEGRGLPPGETLHALLRQEGLMVGWAGGVEHPLADDPTTKLFDPMQAKTLADVERAIADLVAASP